MARALMNSGVRSRRRMNVFCFTQSDLRPRVPEAKRGNVRRLIYCGGAGMVPASLYPARWETPLNEVDGSSQRDIQPHHEELIPCGEMSSIRSSMLYLSSSYFRAWNHPFRSTLLSRFLITDSLFCYQVFHAVAPDSDGPAHDRSRNILSFPTYLELCRFIYGTRETVSAAAVVASKSHLGARQAFASP